MWLLLQSGTMLPQDFWNTYAGGFTPLEFMRLFNSHDPAACSWAYVKERPSLYGIVRRSSWRETFSSAEQHSRIEVHTGLSAYLLETEEEWRETIERELAEAAQVLAVEEEQQEEQPREEVSDTLETASEEVALEIDENSPTPVDENSTSPEPTSNEGGQ